MIFDALDAGGRLLTFLFDRLLSLASDILAAALGLSFFAGVILTIITFGDPPPRLQRFSIAAVMIGVPLLIAAGYPK